MDKKQPVSKYFTDQQSIREPELSVDQSCGFIVGQSGWAYLASSSFQRTENLPRCRYTDQWEKWLILNETGNLLKQKVFCVVKVKQQSATERINKLRN